MKVLVGNSHPYPVIYTDDSLYERLKDKPDVIQNLGHAFPGAYIDQLNVINSELDDFFTVNISVTFKK